MPPVPFFHSIREKITSSRPTPPRICFKVANALARQGTALPLANKVPTYSAIEKTRSAGKSVGASSKRMPCRILVISAGSEPPSQYVSGMNCIFAAQKLVGLWPFHARWRCGEWIPHSCLATAKPPFPLGYSYRLLFSRATVIALGTGHGPYQGPVLPGAGAPVTNAVLAGRPGKGNI